MEEHDIEFSVMMLGAKLKRYKKVVISCQTAR